MKNVHETEAYSKPFQTSKIFFPKKTEADNYFSKSSLLDVL